MRKSQKRKQLFAWTMALVVACYMIASPFMSMKVQASGTTPSEIGQSSSSVTATLTKLSETGAYREYALKIDNKLNESIGDWIVDISMSGVSKVEDWSSWAKVKSSFTSDSLYLAPINGSEGVISAYGSYGATSDGEYKFGYSGSNAIENATVTVYYKTGSSYTGAFDSVMGSSSSGGSSSGGSSTDMNLDVEYNYAKALQYSLYFYDANMCGELENSCSLNWRHNCHLADKQVTYNGKTVDVSGGFHDAGDHDKFGLPQGYSASILGMGYYEYKDAYEQTGQTEHFKKILDYFCDYFVRCTVCDDNGDAIAFCYQVGDGASHNYWMTAEVESIDRPAYFADSSTPATDQVSEAVAALAIHYMNFGNTEYLDCAKKLFAMAQKNEKAAQSSNGGAFYSSTAWKDDYCLAAAWLYKATNDSTYKSEFDKYKSDLQLYSWASWDSVDAYAMAYGSGSMDALEMNATSMKNGGQNGDNGMTWISQWGTNRYNSNVQMEGLIYDKYKNSDSFTSWAQAQMKIILGNNSTKQNYVVGYNANSPKYPHHRTASGYSGFPQDGNQYTEQKYSLIGALVGGPESTTVYHDSSDDYYCNEVALDYNAAFTGALAALYLKNQNDGQQHIVKNGDSDAPSVIKIYYGDGSGEVVVTTTQAPTTEPVTTTQATTTEPATTTQVTTTEPATTTQATTMEPATTTQASTTEPTTVEPVTTTEMPTTGQPTSEVPDVSSEEPVTTTAGVPEQPTSETPDASTEEPATTTAGVPEQPTSETPDASTEEPATTTAGVPEQPTSEMPDVSTEEPATTTAGVPEQPTSETPNVSTEVPDLATTEVPTTTTEQPIISVDRVELNRPSITMKVADTEQLLVFIVPSDATNQNVTWYTSNANVAEVDSNGLVTAVGVGEATITVIADGKMAECKVIVEEVSAGPVVEVSDIVLNKDTMELNKGDSETLSATIYPELAASKTINWHSDNTNVARVDSNGVVTAVGAGETTIYAQVDQVTVQCQVKVYVPVTSVTLVTDTMRLVTGQTSQLTVDVLPLDTTDTNQVWTSDDEEVVYVDAQGNVTARKSGSATVRVTVGARYAECYITVVDAVTGIYLDKENLSLIKGNTAQLNATVEQSDDSVQEVVWNSENSEIASVDNTGKVTAVASGETNITVQTADGKYFAVCNVKVTNPVQELNMDSFIVTLKVAETTQLKANVTPEDADDAQNIEWSVENPAIAEVDANGNVEAKSVGITMVFAKIGEIQTHCIVNVEEAKTLLSNPYIINISELAKNAGYADGFYEKDTVTGELKQTAKYDSASNMLELLNDGQYTIIGEYAGLNIMAGDKTTVNLSGVVCNNVIAGTIVVDASLTASNLIAQNSVIIKNGIVNVEKIAAPNMLISGGSVNLPSSTTTEDNQSNTTTNNSQNTTQGNAGTTNNYPNTTQGNAGTTDNYPNTTQGNAGTTNNYPNTTQGNAGTTDNYPNTTQGNAGTTDNSQNTTQSNPGTTDNSQNTTQGNNNTTADNSQSTTQNNNNVTGGNSQNNTTSTNPGTTQSSNSNTNGNNQTAITAINLKANVKNAAGVPVTSVYKLAKKTSMQLSVSYVPANAPYEAMTFTSSNSSIAQVSATGKITTGNKAGVAQITVTSASGVTKSFYVQVMSGKVTSIKIKVASKTLKLNKKVKLKTVLKKKKKASNKIVWKSSNSAIAKISSSGVLTARKKGKVKITAVVADGSGKKASVVLKIK